jgi:hypothetical protein
MCYLECSEVCNRLCNENACFRVYDRGQCFTKDAPISLSHRFRRRNVREKVREQVEKEAALQKFASAIPKTGLDRAENAETAKVYA